MGITLVHLGLSVRQVERVLACFDEVSHEAVRKWYHGAKDLLRRPPRRRREKVAVDETKIKLEGRWQYLWAAIDVDSWEILAIRVTRSRSSLDTLIFMKEVLKSCENKPRIYVDRGPWYPWALDRLGIEWEHSTFGERNSVEQWYSIFKHRIKRFYRRWPSNASHRTALSWCQSFVALYNLGRCLS